MSRIGLIGLLGILLGFGVAGCNGTNPIQLNQSFLYGPCTADSQCPGEGAICRLSRDGSPDGFCTVPCEDRTPCDQYGVHHHCLTRDGEEQSYCEQHCTSGLDCSRPNYTCSGEYPPSGGRCIGLCDDDVDCGEGAVCDRNQSRCVANDAARRVEGALIGERCRDDEDCLSNRCLEAADGFTGGYCIASCLLPVGYTTARGFYQGGEELPQAGCVDGSVCFPNGGTSEGDLGICFKACASDDDCRTGYECLTRINGGRFTRGVCLPPQE